MNSVSRMRLWVSAAIIALIILIAFALSVPHTHDVAMKKESATATSTPMVALQNVFKKGTHTISGSVEAPNACTPVSATATLVGTASSTENILIALSLPADSGICLQVPTNVTFSVTLAAPNNIPLMVTVNGAQASTTAS